MGLVMPSDGRTAQVEEREAIVSEAVIAARHAILCTRADYEEAACTVIPAN
jgi:hypothetical protein